MLIHPLDMETSLKTNDRRIADIQAVHALWQDIGENNTAHIADDPELLRSVMAGLDYLVLRREQVSPVVGAVSIMDCMRGLAKIDSLAINRMHRGKGYGAQLARRAVEHCVERQYETVMVTAMPSSRRIFDSLGFEPFETHDSGNTTMFLDL